MNEEILNVADIQGNILAGFQKDQQIFLFLRMQADDAALAPIRDWLVYVAPLISSTAEVGRFNRLFKEMRARFHGADPPQLAAAWLNIAFSVVALRRLTSDAEVDQFVDEFFQDGLQARSAGLNDPQDPLSPGHPRNWVVGGPGNEADIVLILAADLPVQLEELRQFVNDSLPRELTVIWRQDGMTLPPPLVGHEHFGFKDGISQPGVRGLIGTSSPQPLTPRLIDPQKTPQDDLSLTEYSKPGQPLVHAGQFVFGYQRQDHLDPRKPPTANPIADGCPAWGRDGSFLVIRRLRQHVPAFRRFIREATQALQASPGFDQVTPLHFATMCVGRWPSGAPLMRTPVDDPALGQDNYANNFFQYVEKSPPPPPIVPQAGYAGDTFATSPRDHRGVICPFSSHIRKINPRDTITEQGNLADTLTRMVLRRGITYGPPFPGSVAGQTDEVDDGVDRGLIFVSYQTSIQDQFVFLQRNWANDTLNPNGGGGEDPIIGQAARSAGAQRTFTVRAPGQQPVTLTVQEDFVTPTGGGFFFSPSISTITNVLGKPNIS